jgi:hypothetical protein
MVQGIVEHTNGVLCGGFYTNDAFFVFVLCVGIRLPCGLLCAGCAHDVSGITNLANNMAVEGRRIVMYLVRLVSQHEGSGWFSVTTYLGGPLRGDSSSGELGFLAEASVSSVLGDVIWPSRLVFSRQVEVDVLLKTATKTYFPLPVRRSASSFALRPPAAMKTERSLQGLVCNFLFFQRGPCKIWAVTTNIFI